MKHFLILILLFLIACQNKISDSDNTKIVQDKASDDCADNFDDFFDTFSKDSIFQKRHVKYPLKVFLYDWEQADPTVHLFNNATEFTFIDFSADAFAMKNEVDKYTVQKLKTKEGMLYKRVGYDNGILIEYHFQWLQGCWYLIEITDKSN